MLKNRYLPADRACRVPLVYHLVLRDQVLLVALSYLQVHQLPGHLLFLEVLTLLSHQGSQQGQDFLLHPLVQLVLWVPALLVCLPVRLLLWTLLDLLDPEIILFAYLKFHSLVLSWIAK